MGTGAAVIVRLLNKERANLDFTSPPQCAMTRNCGANSCKSSPNRGLSHVVMTASAAFSLLINLGLSFCESSVCHRKRVVNRRCCDGGKKERNNSWPAQTMALGRD